MATLSPTELYATVRGAGFQGHAAVLACAIAEAESGRNTGARHSNIDGSIDRGLFQINKRWHPEVSDSCAYDAGCSAKAAYTISAQGTSWSAWTTYSSGAYRDHLNTYSQLAGEPTPQSVSPSSLYGQGARYQMVKSPWLSGTWEVTQGYGPTDYTGEPEGHGYGHWHAGVDIGCDTGTVVIFPKGLFGKVKYLNNPKGYGTALILQLGNNVTLAGATVLQQRYNDIYLGHLRQRLVPDGQTLTGGEHIALSDSTGNSTGPHLHFEVRTPDGKYGTDVDPTNWFLTATSDGKGTNASVDLFGAVSQIEKDIGDIPDAIQSAEKAAMNTAVGLAQAGLGAVLLLGGVVVSGYGIKYRAQGAARIQRHGNRLFRAVSRQPARPRAKPLAPTGAAAARVRPGVLPRQAAANPPAQLPPARGPVKTRMTAAEYQLATQGGIGLQRQRELATQGIRLRPGAAVVRSAA